MEAAKKYPNITTKMTQVTKWTKIWNPSKWLTSSLKDAKSAWIPLKMSNWTMNVFSSSLKLRETIQDLEIADTTQRHNITSLFTPWRIF